ncbi:MAG: hypothetical protein ACYTGQ_09330 [Planctomycetota bacterium]|jgi:hypothetical protein
MFILANTRYGNWHAGLNDVDFTGFLNSGFCLVAAMLCLAYAMLLTETKTTNPHNFHATRRTYRTVWYLMSLGLLLFCLNKQFDLQSLIIPAARHLAMEQDWYPGFHLYRALMLGLIACSGLGLVGFLAWAMRGRFRENRLALSGVLVLGLFVSLRFASFQNIDKDLGVDLQNVWFVHGLESAGFALITVGAAVNLRRLVQENAVGFSKTLSIRHR